MPASSYSLIRMRSFSPRRNLPLCSSQKRAESNYVSAFVRRFLAESEPCGLGIRELEVSGYGIPDFVWCSRKTDSPATPHVTAFEMKLGSWRRALAQAYRYSYFADQSVVVLPPCAAMRAYASVDIFDRTGIGLWSYDARSGHVEKLAAPRTLRARNVGAKNKAVALLSRSTKFRQFLEEVHAF